MRRQFPPPHQLVRLSVASEVPTEAAKLANAIAEAYCDCLRERGGLSTTVKIIKNAVSPKEPIGPSRCINVMLVAGGMVALGFGAS